MYYLQIEDTVGSNNKEEMIEDENYFFDVLANSDIDDQAAFLSQLPFDQVRPVSGFVFCFQLGDSQSEKDMIKTYEAVIQKEKDRLPNQKPRIISKKIIVGTKSDLRTPKELQEMVDKYNKEWTKKSVKFFDTSCYENSNILEFWDELHKEIHQDQNTQDFEQYYKEELKDKNKNEEEDVRSQDADQDNDINNKKKGKGFCANFKRNKQQDNEEDYNAYKKEENNVLENLDEYLADEEVAEAKKKQDGGKRCGRNKDGKKANEKDKNCVIL